jgi:hypothetical protein
VLIFRDAFSAVADSVVGWKYSVMKLVQSATDARMRNSRVKDLRTPMA